MARSGKPDGNLEILDQLTSWASTYKVSDDSYVSGLTEALQSRTNLPFWSTMSAAEFLPQVSVKAAHTQLIYYLTLIRNLLIFAPVAITWLAIGQASQAFSIYTQQNSDAVANFLEFWQDGYGVLAEEWTLSKVATFDASILILIIILIMISSSLEQHSKRHRSVLTRNAEDDRMRVAIAIDSYLFDKRSVTNVTLNQGLSRALQNLKNTTGSLNRTAKIVEKAEKGTPTSRKILTELKKLSDQSKEK